MLKVRIMEVCQRLAGLWPLAWVHRQGRDLKKEKWKVEGNKSNTEFQF
jgi:hypothetical protein